MENNFLGIRTYHVMLLVLSQLYMEQLCTGLTSGQIIYSCNLEKLEVINFTAKLRILHLPPIDFGFFSSGVRVVPISQLNKCVCV